MQGGLKRKHAGTTSGPSKRQRLSLGQDWMDAAADEGMHYTNLYADEAPLTKRARIDELALIHSEIARQHKINPFLKELISECLLANLLVSRIAER